MFTQPATRSPLLRVPEALVASLISMLLASCSPHLATAPERTPGIEPQTRFATSIGNVDAQIVVTLAPGASAGAVAAAYNATVIAVQQGIAVLQPAPVETIEDLQLRMRNDARVLTVEQNALVIPAEVRQKSWSFDDGFGTSSSMQSQPVSLTLGLNDAHALAQNEAAKVAVLDTGIDPTHPMLAPRIMGGWDFIDNDADPTDTPTGLDVNGDGVADGAYGHGTHVAGIVLLTAPRAKLLVARVLDADGRGDVRTVAAGIRWATANGAKVINMSLGMLRQSNAVAAAIHDATVRGVVCVASAGNWGASTPVEWPAANPEVIAVAADDANNRPASFTSFGPQVDICAPGVAIRSTFPGGGYRIWSGTSMSAPFVSGAVAIAKGLHPEWGATEMTTLLTGSVRRMYGISSAQAGQLGAGALNVIDAIRVLYNLSPTDFEDRRVGDSLTSP
jgi:subtilisin family serine protease